MQTHLRVRHGQEPPDRRHHVVQVDVEVTIEVGDVAQVEVAVGASDFAKLRSVLAGGSVVVHPHCPLWPEKDDKTYQNQLSNPFGPPELADYFRVECDAVKVAPLIARVRPIPAAEVDEGEHPLPRPPRCSALIVNKAGAATVLGTILK